MNNHDFDYELQEVFEESYSSIPLVNWKGWLDLSSKEEYESLVLRLSGLSSVDDIHERILVETTMPREFSINVEQFLDSGKNSGPIIFCHTSGTSGGSLSDLKWFHMSQQNVRNLWAPGMQAIFESSGLDSKSSAIIFVPSRNRSDGISAVDETKVIRLYSSEFSQRLVVSLIKPLSYIIEEYNKANTLPIIAKLLSMENVSIVSAPASTLLGWADPGRLRKGIRKSIDASARDDSPKLDELLSLVESAGLDAGTLEIQTRLSQTLSGATLIFSTSFLTEHEWSTIRKFMKWEKGSERFTNLYVGTEIGPFAASIRTNTSPSLASNDMYVFPLTLPVIERAGSRYPLHRSPHHFGRLYVSRLGDIRPVINIDTGDVITVKNQETVPMIGGEVLRAGFRLKTNVVFSRSAEVSGDRQVFVGDYFDLDGLEVANPRRLLVCLAGRYGIDEQSSMLLKSGKKPGSWVMTIPFVGTKETPSEVEIQNSVLECPNGKALRTSVEKMRLHIEVSDHVLIKTKEPRSELLCRVWRGELPKGVLRRWPLYVIPN